METIGKGLLKFFYDREKGELGFASPDTGLQVTDRSDFFRLFLDDGDYKEIPVFSSIQEPKVSTRDGIWEILYEELKAGDGNKYKVKLLINIYEQDTALRFETALTNNDERIRVNEIECPFLQADSFGGERQLDELYYPRGFGWKIQNPWNELGRFYSNYMFKDEDGVWFGDVYPSTPANMAWMGIQSGSNFFYMAQHDSLIRQCVPSVGVNARGEDKQYIRMMISSFPALRAGETENVSPKIAAAWEGDWRKGADYYRSFAEKAFYHPQNPPEWVKRFTGWQRIIMKHQYGEILYRYSDLPRLYAEGAKAGIDTLFVFGWWKGRFDNSYPHYEPDEKLGGAEELKKAIEEIQKAGGRVILYTNGCLIDIQSEFYKSGGNKAAMLDIDGNEYRDHYQFAGDGMLLRKFGYKSFVYGCMTTPEWQERLVMQGNVMKEFTPDSIFYDQIGTYPFKPCFNNKHPHGNRIDRDWMYRVNVFKKLKSLCTKDMALGTEHLSDVGCSMVDYTHNVSDIKPGSPYSFPYLFRYTFPEIITTNRRVHEEYPGFEDDLILPFIFGMRYCVSIYRCRGHLGMMPKYTACLKRLIDLRAEYEDYMVYGKFTYCLLEPLPDKVEHAEYIHKDGKSMLQVLWNRSDNPVEYGGRTISSREIAFVIKDL